MVIWYFLVFCRVTLGLVFAISFGGKVLHPSRFQETIRSFHLLPHTLNGVATSVFLGSELLVVLGMVLGGIFLLPAFVLALLLLLLFSGAMVSVLVRRLHTSCNCFGTSEKPVSLRDVWRNAGFGCCALGGWGILAWTQGMPAGLSGPLWLLAALGAGVFVLVWMQLGEITQLFTPR